EALARRRDQPVDLRDREYLRQRSSALGSFDDGGRIILAVSFRTEKAVQLADRRKPSRHRRGREAAIGERGQIASQVRRGRRRNCVLAGREVADQIVEITSISLKRISGATALRRHHIEEQRGQSPLWGFEGLHLRQCCCLTKRSGGTVTTI